MGNKEFTWSGLRFKDSCRYVYLDSASKVFISASQRIFMARDCREWL